jgi:hypothetical protein
MRRHDPRHAGIRKRRVPRHETSHWFTVGGIEAIMVAIEGVRIFMCKLIVSLAELVDEFVVEEKKIEAEYLHSEKALMVFYFCLLYCS